MDAEPKRRRTRKDTGMTKVRLELPRAQFQMLEISARILGITVDELVAETLSIGMRTKRFNQLDKVYLSGKGGALDGDNKNPRSSPSKAHDDA